jgi:hypothetical protein
MKNLVLFCYCLFLFSCQFNEEKAIFKNKIKVLKSLSISLDSLTPQQLFNPQLLHEKYLIFLNNKANSLDFYGLEEKKITKRIKLQTQGENSVGNIRQFLYHNSDSIFVVNSYQYQVFLIDESGKVKKKYSLISQKKHSATTAMPATFPFHHPLVLIKNQLHIPSYPDDDPYLDSFYHREALSIVLDLNTGSFRYKMKYPKKYRNNYFATGSNFYSRIFIAKEQKFVYSFFADNHIQVLNKDYQMLEEKKLQSPHFVDIPSLRARIQSSEENTKAFNESPSYSNIYYNPYKKEFYRAIQVPITNKNSEKDAPKGFFGIFDDNFKNIGEVLFYETDKLNYYLFLNMFFTPEGIWIQRLTDNEDELVYDLIDFVGE